MFFYISIQSFRSDDFCKVSGGELEVSCLTGGSHWCCCSVDLIIQKTLVFFIWLFFCFVIHSLCWWLLGLLLFFWNPLGLDNVFYFFIRVWCCGLKSAADRLFMFLIGQMLQTLPLSYEHTHGHLGKSWVDFSSVIVGVSEDRQQRKPGFVKLGYRPLVLKSC